MKYILLSVAMISLLVGCSTTKNKQCRTRFYKGGMEVEVCNNGNTVDVNVKDSPSKVD